MNNNYIYHYFFVALVGEAAAAGAGVVVVFPGDFLLLFVDFCFFESSIFDIKYHIEPPTRATKMAIYTYLTDDGTSSLEIPKNFISNLSSPSNYSFVAYLSSLLTCIYSSKFLMNFIKFSWFLVRV